MPPTTTPPAPGEIKAADSYLSYTFNTAGTYYIGVSNHANKSYEPREGYDDNGAGSTGAYTLSLINQTTAATAAVASAAFSEVPIASSMSDRGSVMDASKELKALEDAGA